MHNKSMEHTLRVADADDSKSRIQVVVCASEPLQLCLHLGDYINTMIIS